MDSNQHVCYFSVPLPVSMSDQSSRLGLTLRKSASFLDLVQMRLYQGGTRLMNNAFPPQPVPEKLKASNFCASFLRIGSWKVISIYEGDVVAKCYYAKRKLVWEVLDDGLKSKLEIQWSDISAIRAIFCENEHDILEIELNHPPLFFGETNPQPRKHTLWQASSDFTGGQATISRRHFLQFPEGTLEKHYEKLLLCDERLYMLSQRPFPSVSMPPFFQVNHAQYQDYFSQPNNLKPEFSSMENHPSVHDSYLSQYAHLGNPRSTVVPPPLIMKSEHLVPTVGLIDSTSPSSVIDFSPIQDNRTSLMHQTTPFLDERINNEWDIGEKIRDPIQELPVIASSNQVSPLLPQPISCNGLSSMDEMGRFSSDDWGLNTITEHLLHDPEPQAPLCSDEQTLAAQVNSMYNLITSCPQPDSKYDENIDFEFEEYGIENVMNDLAASIGSEWTNDDTSTCTISSNWLDVPESNEQLISKLPRIESYPYFFLDQNTQNFPNEQPNMTLNPSL